MPAGAQEKVLNLYSARHYQTDEALYANFTRQTGIKINRIEGKEDELLERIRNEGADSPADIFITVDAARLAQADALGLFAPVKSKMLEERIPGQPAHRATGSPSPPARGSSSTTRLTVKRPHGAELRGPRQADPEGQGLLRSGCPPLQPVAWLGADPSPWRTEDRGMGQRRGRQFRPRAQGRRHRPDQGGGRRRMRRRRSPIPTTSCA